MHIEIKCSQLVYIIVEDSILQNKNPVDSALLTHQL